MKKISVYIFLIFFNFITSSFSDNISDFQIEGISVGDSVNDYFTTKTLNKTAKEKEKFYFMDSSERGSYSKTDGGAENKEVNIPVKDLEHYDDVRISYFSGSRDSTLITDITGIKYYKKNNCDGKQKESFNAVKKVLEGDYKLDKKIEAGNIHLKQFTFHLENGGSIVIACYDAGKTNNDIDWISALMLTINIEGLKEPKFNTSSGNEVKTGSDLIQIRPSQDDIGKRIKF